MDGEEKLRLFIALNFDRETRRAVRRIQEELWGDASRPGLTRTENLHLTLAFLGDVDPARLPDLRMAMEKAEPQRVELTFDRLGVFRREGGGTWWLGGGENRPLEELQARLAKALRAAGFPLEDRPFRAHLTLSRRTAPNRGPGPLKRSVRTSVDTVSLMRSHRVEGKLVYTELYRI